MSSQVTQLRAAKGEATSRLNCLLSFIRKWSWIFPLSICIRLERVCFFAPWFWCYSPHMDYWRTISPSFLQDPGVCLSSVRIAFVFDTEMLPYTWIQPVWNELLLLWNPITVFKDVTSSRLSWPFEKVKPNFLRNKARDFRFDPAVSMHIDLQINQPWKTAL